MTKRQTTIITALSIAAFLLALAVSGRYWFRLDLTKNKAYTISQVSRNLHREIPDQVNITYYISDRLRTVIPAPGEIEDTLREYAAFSRGKIRLTVRDPVRTGVARMVEELGIQARQVQNVEQDQASLVTVYSGIVIEYLDKVSILPWVISTETLEYDLTSRIRTMVNDTERIIGVIVGENNLNWRDHFGFLNAILVNSGFTVRVLSPGEPIPDSLPALFVFGGIEGLNHWALYRIDRYIQLGGRVMFAVDGIFVDTYGTIEAKRMFDYGLHTMLVSYGVTIRQEFALDRNALMIQFQTISQAGTIQHRIARYPLWIGVLGDNGNPDHPVTAGFAGLDLYWASPLELHPVPNVESTFLFTTSPEAWAMTEDLHTSPEIPYLLELEASRTRGTKILGASLSGVFPSFFRDHPKPVRQGSGEELPDMPEHARASRIIVVGDTDFATNILSATQNVARGEHPNLDFILRVADWLFNDDDIIGIRNRQPQAGRFDKILDLDKRASAKRFSQVVNVGLVPLFVITIGIVLAFRRRANANIKSVKGQDIVSCSAGGSDDV
jgi:gliding-associated putative ABC transporter substrate-binding component GldG